MYWIIASICELAIFGVQFYSGSIHEDEEDFLGVECWTSTEGALPLRCPSRGEDLAVMGVGLSVMEGCYWWPPLRCPSVFIWKLFMCSFTFKSFI